MQYKTPYEKFLYFLESLRTEQNAILLEAVSRGYRVIQGLYESPENLSFPKLGIERNFKDQDAYAFVYSEERNMVFVSDPGMTHYDITRKLVKDSNENISKGELFRLVNHVESNSYMGRLWTGVRAISFWKYPSETLFKTILLKLNKKGFAIDDTWKVEVYLREGSTVDRSTTLIPIGEYAGEFVKESASPLTQEELDALRELHTMDPIVKSKMPKRDVPVKELNLGNKTMAEYNNEIRQGSD